MKNFKNSRFNSTRNRFKIEIAPGKKESYIVRDTKYNHIVHKCQFKEDADEFCRFQNKHCTWGKYEFPKFMRPRD